MKGPMNSADYVHWSSLITNSVLIKSIEANYPTLTIAEQDALLIEVLDRIARIHGWSLKREPDLEKVDNE
jgi:hypothetical protein